MACDRWQQALSAMADGEDPGVEPRLLDAHLATCLACRTFADFTTGSSGGAHHHAPAHLAIAEPMPDLAPRVRRLNAMADRAGSWSIVRVLLGMVGVEVIVVALRALVLGVDSDSSVHAARHLGAFSVAYGVGLLVVTVRPARARTMLPVAAVLAGALAITAVVDMANGEVPLVNETSHIPELISVVLLWLLAVPSGRRLRRAGGSLRAVGTEDAAAADDQTGASTLRSGRRWTG